MEKQGIKIIPNKGTRLRMMIVVEFLSIIWSVYAMANVPEVSEIVNFTDAADFQLKIFAAWSDFTIWNVGTYVASETFVKGTEGIMNRDIDSPGE